MTLSAELITVDATNLEEHGFFCYKSKPRSEGHRKKLMWVRDRLSEGMVITLEPGMSYMQGKQMVHEENILITESGATLLSKRAAAELPIIP